MVSGFLNAEKIEKSKAVGYEGDIIDDLSEMLDARKREVYRSRVFRALFHNRHLV